MKKELDSKRPFPKETLRTLRDSINLEWTYNSNGIEGNTLTLKDGSRGNYCWWQNIKRTLRSN